MKNKKKKELVRASDQSKIPSWKRDMAKQSSAEDAAKKIKQRHNVNGSDNCLI